MDNIKSIRFGDVELGDFLYDPNYFTNNKWREITDISVSSKVYVDLAVGVSAHKQYDTRTHFVGHADEGVFIKKELPNETE